MKRPVILVDLDNVVYDWVGAMIDWLDLNNVFNIERLGAVLQARHPQPGVWWNKATKTLAKRLYSQWAVWEDWGIPKGEFIRWWRLGIEEGWIYGQGPLIPGARNALWQLSDAEWHIHIATSRLTKFGLHDKIVENTAQWLRENNIPYRDLSFVANKHRLVADAIVDDRLDNMDLSGGVHANYFHFGAPHNDSDLTWDGILSLMAESGML